MNNLEGLQGLLNYKFNDENLLKQALTHLSYANENSIESYERLEFLGDAVIELIVSDYIYRTLDFGAGDSTKLRSSLVSTEYLCNLVLELGLDKFVYKSKSLQQLSKKNIADIFESIVGAVYIDGGYEPASVLVNKLTLLNDNFSPIVAVFATIASFTVPSFNGAFKASSNVVAFAFKAASKASFCNSRRFCSI